MEGGASVGQRPTNSRGRRIGAATLNVLVKKMCLRLVGGRVSILVFGRRPDTLEGVVGWYIKEKGI